MTIKERYARVLETFAETIPEPQTELHFDSPYQLLLAVILSAQCTDKRINMITPALFDRFPTVQDLAAATPEDVYPFIRSVTYPNAKSKSLVKVAQRLVEEFNGEIPRDIDTLVTLPGVGRKTANLILGDIFGQEGYVCDTHCIRITGRLGITDGSKDPLQVERQLRQCIPPKESSDFCHRMVLFGRDTCTARSPKCEGCPLAKDCDTAKGKKN